MSDDVSLFSDEERELIRSSVRRLLADKWPLLQAVEFCGKPDAVRKVWNSLGSLSLQDLGREPSMGGLLEVFPVFEELGRACCPAPLLGALVANFLAAGAQNGATPLREDGITAVGFGPFDGDRAAGRVSLSQDSVSGAVHFVEGADIADRYVLFLAEPSGVAVVQSHVAGVSLESTPALSIPSLFSVRFEESPAAFIPMPAEKLAGIAQVARLASASRALGSARRAYELVVEHAGTRKQFGKFIGQFQAVQHRLVDNLTRLDGAQLTLQATARAHDDGLETWRTFADLALAHLNPGLRQLAIDMHQIMGAVGYSEEHELPRHFRQIHGNIARFGGAFRARAAVGAYLVAASGKEPQ